jgi:hypothetical protein
LPALHAGCDPPNTAAVDAAAAAAQRKTAVMLLSGWQCSGWQQHCMHVQPCMLVRVYLFAFRLEFCCFIGA